MLRFLADENFNGDIRRGLMRAVPQLEFERVQDVGLLGADDEDILEWAAADGAIIVTHDVQTMPGFAWARVRRRLSMTGVFVVPREIGIGAAIRELQLFAEATEPSEWIDQVIYLPLEKSGG